MDFERNPVDRTAPARPDSELSASDVVDGDVVDREALRRAMARAATERANHPAPHTVVAHRSSMVDGSVEVLGAPEAPEAQVAPEHAAAVGSVKATKFVEQRSARAGDDQSPTRSWESRPIASRLVRLGVTLVPIAVGALFAVAASRVLPQATSVVMAVLRALLVVALTTGVVRLVDKASRRFLPLAALLQLSLVFPDQAPDRMRAALKAGSSRRLARNVEEARTNGLASDPGDAARQVVALISAIGDHDRRTRGHSERVRLFADLIGEELHLSKEERQKLQWGALLHDLGKLMVPDEILNKKGKPTDEEWSILQSHPAEGMRLVEPLREFLGEWVYAIGGHHEKWNGTGYPEGLRGDGIPRAAAIVAVADSFEVMTAVRSYKRAMPLSEARAELTRCSGTHFSPEVVRAFLKVSLGDLRLVSGPLASLAQVPFVQSIMSAPAQVGGLASPVLGAAAAAPAAAAATAAAVVAAVAGAVAVVGSGPATADEPPAPVESAIVTTVPELSETVTYGSSPNAGKAPVGPEGAGTEAAPATSTTTTTTTTTTAPATTAPPTSFQVSGTVKPDSPPQTPQSPTAPASGPSPSGTPDGAGGSASASNARKTPASTAAPTTAAPPSAPLPPPNGQGTAATTLSLVVRQEGSSTSTSLEGANLQAGTRYVVTAMSNQMPNIKRVTYVYGGGLLVPATTTAPFEFTFTATSLLAGNSTQSVTALVEVYSGSPFSKKVNFTTTSGCLLGLLC